MGGHSSTSDDELAAVVALVTQARETAWQSCALGYGRAPGALSEVPSQPDLAAAHRALSRAATSCAQTAQALLMAPGPEAAARAARAANRWADEALEALTSAPS